MRHIEGYVFIADFGSYQQMFGKKTLDSSFLDNQRKFDAFESNGLSPYEETEQARQGARDYERKMQRNSPKKIELAEVCLTIAEDHNEAQRELENETDLVVIMINNSFPEVERNLLGPLVSGCRSFGAIPGAFLKDTNYRTFRRTPNRREFFDTPYKRAEYLAKEINRQAQCGAMIAKFKLKRLEQLS